MIVWFIMVLKIESTREIEILEQKFIKKANHLSKKIILEICAVCH